MTVDIAELASLLKQQRAKSGLSLRELAAETGVPYTTLSRVESGRIPDLKTFRSIVGWLGISPERFFQPQRRVHQSLPDVIASVIRDDETLAPGAREQLISVFSQMYA